MDISLTPELETLVNEKLASGLYRDASEVVREALRFMKSNEDWIQRAKLAQLRVEIANGEDDLAAGRFTELSVDDLPERLQIIKQRAVARLGRN